MGKGSLPLDLAHDLRMVKMLVDEMDYGAVEFLKRLSSTYVERLSDAEQMLLEHLTRVVPYFRMYSATIREIFYQSTMPPQTPQLKRITRQRQADGVVKQGQLVTFIAKATLKGKLVKKVCVRIQCIDCHKQFNYMDNFVSHKSCKSERSADYYVPGRTCPLCRNPHVKLDYIDSYKAHFDNCDGFGTTSSKRASKKRKYNTYYKKCEKCCEHTFVDHASYTEHVAKCTGTKDVNPSGDHEHIYAVKFQCEICGDNFTSQHNYDKHQRKHEQRANDAEQVRKEGHELKKCPTCEVEMFEYNLAQHMKTHKRVLKGGAVKCPFCKTSTHRSNMMKHLERRNGICSHNNHEYKCPKCREQFLNSTEFVAHLSCKGIKMPSTAMIDGHASTSSVAVRDGVMDETKRVATCAICKYQFNSQETLETHVSQMHPNPDDRSCSACGARYYARGVDVQHQQICRAPRPCRYCWTMFPSQNDLTSHAESCSFKCKCMACLQMFKSRSELKTHVEHAHVRMIHACATCGFMCENQDAMDLHEAHCIAAEGGQRRGAIQQQAQSCANQSNGQSSGTIQQQAQTGRKQSRTERLLAVARRTLTPNCPARGNQAGVPGKQAHIGADTKQTRCDMPQVKGKGSLKPGTTSTCVEKCVSAMQGSLPVGSSSAERSQAKANIHVDVSNSPSSIVDVVGKCIESCNGGSEKATEYAWTKELEHITLNMSDADELIAHLVQLSQEVPPLVTKFTPAGVLADQVDVQSVKCLSEDMLKKWYPVKTKTDGNCMARAISRILFGTEDRWAEVRIRIAIEAALHESRYLSEDELMSGLRPEQNTTKSTLAWHYMQQTSTFDEAYQAGRVQAFDEATLSTLYKEDLLRWSKDTVWLGMWQLHMASNMCGRMIDVVHPIPDDKHRDWHLFNRTLVPHEQVAEQRSLRIMFTSTLTSSTATMPTLEQINHFVPLIERV